MPNAMEYLLISKIKDECGLNAVTVPQMWMSVFPKAFLGVAASTQGSKATGCGKKPYYALLSDFAEEWRGMEGFAEFVAAVDELRPQINRRDYSAIAGHVAKISGLRDAEGHYRVARKQLIAAVKETVMRDGYETVICAEGDEEPPERKRVSLFLGPVVEEFYRDALSDAFNLTKEVNDFDEEDYRGLACLFSMDFKESFGSLLEKELATSDGFAWPKFWQDYRGCQDIYHKKKLTRSEAIDLMASVVSMCILACLIGPGAYASDLGWTVDTSTVFGPQIKETATAIARYQLQPVVFVGQDAWSYYCDGADPIVFSKDDVVRFGRYGGIDPRWSEECVFIPCEDNSVSRKHAELRHTSTGWYLTDLGTTEKGSLNGTIVFRAYGRGVIFRKSGYSELDRKIKLSTGDIIYLGPSNGGHYSVEKRYGSPKVDLHAHGKAYRFERIDF